MHDFIKFITNIKTFIEVEFPELDYMVFIEVAPALYECSALAQMLDKWNDMRLRHNRLKRAITKDHHGEPPTEWRVSFMGKRRFIDGYASCIDTLLTSLMEDLDVPSKPNEWHDESLTRTFLGWQQV